MAATFRVGDRVRVARTNLYAPAWGYVEPAESPTRIESARAHGGVITVDGASYPRVWVRWDDADKAVLIATCWLAPAKRDTCGVPSHEGPGFCNEPYGHELAGTDHVIACDGIEYVRWESSKADALDEDAYGEHAFEPDPESCACCCRRCGDRDYQHVIAMAEAC
jgi:hypothetical protein